MKNIIIIIIIVITSISCKAQQIVGMDYPILKAEDYDGKYFKDLDGNYDKFVGTWQNTIGNMTFKVILFKTEKRPYGDPVNHYMDRISGRFLMIENLGTPNEREVYNSMKYMPTLGGTPKGVISGGAGTTTMSGTIWDNTITSTILPSGMLWGEMSLKILNIGNTPLQARWKVFRKGLSLEGVEFNVPTDIILTKQ
ncbi:MAG: hypothetical protein NWQ31_02980 [Polaribacter sp.]|nr:hypothetical protein [Polaribacter sp.]